MSLLNSSQFNAFLFNGAAVAPAAPAEAPRYTKTRTPGIVYIASRTANMAVLNQRITSLVAGDTWPFYMTYSISTSGITFSKIYLTIKNDPTDADVDALVQKSVTTSATTSGQITDDATAGGSIAFNIYVAKTESVLLTPGEDYYYDFQGIGSDGAVYTFETGIITPAQGVTTASS